MPKRKRHETERIGTHAGRRGRAGGREKRGTRAVMGEGVRRGRDEGRVLR